VSALALPTPFRRSLLPRPLYACAGAAFLIAGAGVAARNAVQSLEHGWWLASFLALVGGVAQVLLGAGQRTVAQPSSLVLARRATIRQAALWNTGTLLVPLGVLTDVRLPVVLGSVALLWALARLAADLRRSDPRPAQRVAQLRASFVSLLVFLAISVLIGTALAWDLPWM
jgi:hypothetical protein